MVLVMPQNNNQQYGLCKISICPPESSTNLDYVLNNGIFSEQPKNFIIEFGSEKSDIRVKVGQKIKIDDVIGFIKGIKVKSKVEGVVTEVYDRYFIGEETSSVDEILEDFGIIFRVNGLVAQLAFSYGGTSLWRW